MANNYKIRIQVEIEECVGPTTDGPQREGVGAFEWIIPSEQAHSIDDCEQSLLQVNADALRDAFAYHLSYLSRQHALELTGSLEECEVKSYRVDGEVGRITFDTYWVEPMAGDRDADPTPLFSVLRAKEWYRTTGFKEIALVYGTTESSYRQTRALINRVRHQAEATPARTLRENTEREGQEILAHMDQQAEQILDAHGFTPDGAPTEKQAQEYSDRSLVTLPSHQVQQALLECAPDSGWVADMADNPVPYEDPAHSAQVSLDDVNVKRQKATRQGTQAADRGRKYVHNTVAHITHAGDAYIISGSSVVHVLRLVLAFLLHNHLLQSNLIFLVDGQRTLYTAILRAFAWSPSFHIILDWYHLEKRCKEQLSLALKGRIIRNTVLEQLRPCLWYGCVDRAIAVLKAVEPSHIKDQDALETLIGYLERNRPYLPCYAVRKRLGLRNSSNQGEKANDLVVSDRQKHNGMSWSKPGSVFLAAVTALVRNQEYKRWFRTGALSFSFQPSG
jgi:hypothetical protein